MDFETKVFAMYQERIASGMDPEKAKHFDISDFPGIDTHVFAGYIRQLYNHGYITKEYLRNFTLSQSAVDEIS